MKHNRSRSGNFRAQNEVIELFFMSWRISTLKLSKKGNYFSRELNYLEILYKDVALNITHIEYYTLHHINNYHFAEILKTVD